MSEVMDRQVLVVRLPDRSDVTARELRDYIVESLQLGVLVLSQGVTFKLEELPDLGGVKVSGDRIEEAGFVLKHGIERAELPAQINDLDGLAPAPSLSPEAEEKQVILARLKRFRSEFGPGCLENLSRRCGKGLGSEVLRGVCLGEAVLPITDWRRINKALDRLHFEIPAEDTANG